MEERKKKKYTVRFEPSGLKIQVPSGSVLLDAAHKAGIYLSSICGGDGYCGKCKVIIDEGQSQSRPTTLLTPDEIRQNIVEILYHMKQGYGYDIFKIYKNIFPSVTMRVIYYHLKKGADLGEFKVHEVKKEEGKYSWGNSVEKIYYALGDKAKPMMNDRVKEFFDNK